MGRLVWLGATLIAAGCSAGDGGDFGAGGETAQKGNATGAKAAGNGATNGSGFGDQSGAQNGTTTGFGECAAVSAEAMPGVQPADIIIAVDTSGSMDEETAWVQQHLNDLSTIIAQSGIDAHVVLIADPSVCIPAPLGSGQCGGADENLPSYRHVPQGVASTNALELFIQTYPQWKAQLRQGASKTFVVVTDDNSDMSAGDFTAQVLALDPPTFQGFKFDGIMAYTEPFSCLMLGACPANNACCFAAGPLCTSYAAAEGKVYKELVAQTAGVQGDLCAQDFGPVFMDIATSVVQSSTIACDFAIPPPPAGEAFDLNKVNVQYTPGGGAAGPVFNVPGGFAACDASGGWYYDDPQNPTKIVLCPATCDAIRADTAAKIDVLFGCDTVVIPA